jgi:hypothetical protein
MESPPSAPDVYAVLVALVQIETRLRWVANHSASCPPATSDFERIVNVVTVMQGAVDRWLDTAPLDQPQDDRCQLLERRRHAERRTGADRREPPSSDVVA